MGTSDECVTACKATGSPLHTIAFSPQPAKLMAVPTEARQDSAACKRIEGDLSASCSPTGV